VQKVSTKNFPGEELSGEELSERKIVWSRTVRAKNCPSEELFERKIVRFDLKKN
jgi:hypothetical protein